MTVKPRLAICDDYMRAAFKLADWSEVQKRCNIDVFDRALRVPDEAAEILAPYDILCTMRERMRFPRALFERLPNLKLLVATGDNHPNYDIRAAGEHGVTVCNTGVGGEGGGYASASELTWGLLLATARRIADNDRAMRGGAWQTSFGFLLKGKTIGLIGMGNVGEFMARFAHAFGMRVVTWSPSLTEERAAQNGATLVSKDELFQVSDVVSVHVRLSDRSRGMIGAREIGLMKSTAILINTSRGPLVDQEALISALEQDRIAGAGLDVYDEEPLAADHPIRRVKNTVLTPHVGYLTEDLLRYFYKDTVVDVLAWLDGSPVRVVNQEFLTVV